MDLAFAALELEQEVTKTNTDQSQHWAQNKRVDCFSHDVSLRLVTLGKVIL